MKQLGITQLLPVALAFSLCGLPPAATAQGSSASAAAAAGEAKTDDRRFAEKAASDGLAEVQLGGLAQRNGASAEIKQFGALMVRDHSQANEELRRVAAVKGLPLPAEPDGENRDLINRLQRLSGPQFDRAYMQAMLEAHRKDVALFERQARTGRDADLKAFAEKTLPNLQQHLKHAEDVGWANGSPVRSGTPGQP